MRFRLACFGLGLAFGLGLFGFLILGRFEFLLFGLFVGFFAFFLGFRLTLCQFAEFVFVVFAFELGDYASQEPAVGFG